MISPGMIEFLKEQFEPLGGVTVKRMFGGVGVWRDGLMFALAIDDTLYLKVDGDTRAGYEAEGSTPFSYPTRDGRATITSYWRAPERLFDDPDELVAWARRSVEVARRAEILKAGKPASAPRRRRRAASVEMD